MPGLENRRPFAGSVGSESPIRQTTLVPRCEARQAQRLGFRSSEPARPETVPVVSMYSGSSVSERDRDQVLGGRYCFEQNGLVAGGFIGPPSRRDDRRGNT